MSDVDKVPGASNGVTSEWHPVPSAGVGLFQAFQPKCGVQVAFPVPRVRKQRVVRTEDLAPSPTAGCPGRLGPAVAPRLSCEPRALLRPARGRRLEGGRRAESEA